MIDDLASGAGLTLLYAAMGLALLVAGFFALDLVTPGRLGAHIMGHSGSADEPARPPSMNAAVLAAASLLATAAIVFTALWTNVADGIGQAVAATLVYGLLGIVVQVVGFLGVDAVTPGRLGAAVVRGERLHPATVLASASQLAVAAVVVASIA